MIVLMGASGGIGKELVPHLASIDSVIATYHRQAPGFGLKSVEEIRLDLNSEDETRRFADRLAGLEEKITFINMATLSPDSLLVNMALDDWTKAFHLNVHSSFLILKKLLPKMIKDEWGRLIFVSSVVAENGPVGASAYASSKAALGGLSKTLAHEYGRFNITSNVLMIGYFDKGLIHTLKPDVQQTILKRIPSKQFGDVKNIFHAIDFIRKADYLNGATLRLDGGLE